MPDRIVLVNKPIHPKALERLRAQTIVLTPFEAPEHEVRAMLPGVHAILLDTGLSMGPADIDLASNLEVIGRNGVGLDNVDLQAATKRGIPVVYCPYGPTESTAEHALLLILATARRLSHLDRAVRAKDFSIQLRPVAMGRELEGKALGVVGFGRIGRRLAEMCHTALHMPVFIYDPHLDRQAVTELGAVFVDDLTELAAQVDVLSIHTPLTVETRRLIGGDVIRAMKPGAILVNTSRGPVVDETALLVALQSGHLSGAGLDVYDPQPPSPDNPLLQMDQVVLTPHVAGYTDEGLRRMGLTVVEDILRVFRGERPEFPANPEVWQVGTS